jgi:hypothetical protein
LKNQKTFPWHDVVPITIHFSANNRQRGAGWFNLAQKTMDIVADTNDISSIKIFIYRVNTIRDTINHECLHMFQTLLRDITGAFTAGGVGKQYQSMQESFLGSPQVPVKPLKNKHMEYEEVYAPIAEDFAFSVKRFSRIVKKDVPYADLMTERARAWVGFPNKFVSLAKELKRPELKYTDPFFINLKKQNIKHWKLIANKFIIAAQVVTRETLQTQHALRDIEFYTNLTDSVRDFQRIVGKFNPEIIPEFAKMWVGIPNNFIEAFFKQTYKDLADDYEQYKDHWTDHLEKHAPKLVKQNPLFERLELFAPEKYKKAVKEFFKAVGV